MVFALTLRSWPRAERRLGDWLCLITTDYRMSETASLFVLGSFVVACSAKVARLRKQDKSLRAEGFTGEAGGKGFNLALGAHRLGGRVDGLLAIGNDFFSQLA